MVQRSPFPALLLALLLAPSVFAQDPLRDRAADAFLHAQEEEAALMQRPAAERTRTDHLRLLRSYERVYLITPHTGYADDALLKVAELYERIGDADGAIRTLEFLVREYPASRFVPDARNRIAVLRTPPPTVQTAAASADRAPGLTLVDNVRFWESPRSVRIVVDLDGQATFRQGSVQDPPRVYVDIENARVGSMLERQRFPVQSVMLENIRVGQFDPRTVRIVLDLVDPAEARDVTIFTLRDPDRLLIDVLGAGQRPAVAGNRPATTPVAGPETPILADATATIPPRVATAQPAENGDRSLIRSLGLKIGRVVIDPGHGGHDTGTIGPSGLTEKELVLDIARRLQREIETRLGAEVVLTRQDDTFIPLEARTALANQAGADLFLSIHANASRSSATRGFETYFLNFNPSREAMEIAARENATSQASISALQDIVQSIMLRDKADESREFAAHVQNALVAGRDRGMDRGVKQAPFVVLIGANMPSILAEVSFISNPEDERQLSGEAGRQQIAEALFEGVRSYAETLSGVRAAQAQD